MLQLHQHGHLSTLSLWPIKSLMYVHKISLKESMLHIVSKSTCSLITSSDLVTGNQTLNADLFQALSTPTRQAVQHTSVDRRRNHMRQLGRFDFMTSGVCRAAAGWLTAWRRCHTVGGFCAHRRTSTAATGNWSSTSAHPVLCNLLSPQVPLLVICRTSVKPSTLSALFAIINMLDNCINKALCKISDVHTSDCIVS